MCLSEFCCHFFLLLLLLLYCSVSLNGSSFTPSLMRPAVQAYFSRNSVFLREMFGRHILNFLKQTNIVEGGGKRKFLPREWTTGERNGERGTGRGKGKKHTLALPNPRPTLNQTWRLGERSRGHATVTRASQQCACIAHYFIWTEKLGLVEKNEKNMVT